MLDYDLPPDYDGQAEETDKSAGKVVEADPDVLILLDRCQDRLLPLVRAHTVVTYY